MTEFVWPNPLNLSKKRQRRGYGRTDIAGQRGRCLRGDARRGQSLEVRTIAEGRACAKAVDEYLMDYTNLL